MTHAVRHPVAIKHLEYELRMLFGAAKLQQLISSKLPGNIENYLKDSVYVHVRNLYGFFVEASTGNDDSISLFGEQPMTSTLYPRPWRAGINTNVMHIRDRRADGHNVHNGKHINECIEDFVDDIERMWLEWITITQNQSLKKELEEALANARRQSRDDLEYFKRECRIS
jgi:hypothetical protein